MKRLFLKGDNGDMELTEEGIKIYRNNFAAKMIYGFGSAHKEKTIKTIA